MFDLLFSHFHSLLVLVLISSFPCQKYLQEKPDLLSRFMAATEKNPEKYSNKYLRDIVMNFIIAGRDTSAITLSWFFHLLCQNPDVEKRLLQDIKDVVKADNDCVLAEESISVFAESLTHTVLDKMQYLHAALTETLRLYPPIPLVSHFMCIFCWKVTTNSPPRLGYGSFILIIMIVVVTNYFWNRISISL
jgi:hypothetical protein